MMKLKTKRRIRKYTAILIGILILAIALIISYFQNKLLETCITIILFYTYRSLFEKQFHAKSVYLCAFISFIILLIIIQLEIPLSVSLIYSSVLTFIITLISYYIRDYLDNKVLCKMYKTKLEQLNNKAIENLTELELINALPKIKYETIHIVYNYLHKPKHITAVGFAYRTGISEATLYRYVKQVKEEYENLGLNS